MKNLFLSLILLFISSSIIAQNNASIFGKITNPVGDSVFIFSSEIINGKYARKQLDATALEKDGSFNLSAHIEKTTDLTFTDGNENAPLILSPNDKISLSLNTSFFDETLRYSGVGAEKNNAIMVLYLIEETMNNQLFENMEKTDTSSLFMQFDENHKAYIDLVKDYKESIPEFVAYADNILNLAERNKKQMKNYIAFEVAFKAQMKKLENKPAIDFEGINLKGEKTKLSDYKGKLIVVDFWATWCGPCKAEFPAYKKLEEEYGKEINFVSVGAFCKEDEWKEMANNEGFQHNIYLSKEAQKQIEGYQINSIPRYLIIDENFNLIDAAAPRPSSGKLPTYWGK